jgi:maltose alpha-D-glucosyltransferase/alpha-amylase
MVRSFHYAAYLSLLKEAPIRTQDKPFLEPWAELWSRFVGGAFFKSYLDEIGESDLIPKESEQQEMLMKAFLLEKAVYELGYELNNRPDWVVIPIRGIKQLLEADGR